jgi:energy-converting hydrogenase Eha subunit A
VSEDNGGEGKLVIVLIFIVGNLINNVSLLALYLSKSIIEQMQAERYSIKHSIVFDTDVNITRSTLAWIWVVVWRRGELSG